MEWSLIFFEINLFSALVPAIYGFLKFRRFEYPTRYVYFYIIANLCLTIISLLPVKSLFGLESNHFVYFLMAGINLGFKVLIYRTVSFKSNLILYALVILYFSLFLILFMMGYSFKTACVWVVVEALVSVALSFVYLITLHKNFKEDSLRKNPLFWISLAFFISGVFNFLLYSYASPLLEYDQNLLILIFAFFVPINETLINILITVGFYFKIKQ